MSDSMERKQKITYKLSIKKYLLELNHYCHKPVTESSLLSLEETAKIKNTNIKNISQTTRLTIPFEDKNLPRFSALIRSIFKQDSGPMFIWTDLAENCGCAQIDNIMDFNFNFPFSASSNGIVIIISKNLTDEMILDYYLDEDNKEMLEVDLIGNNWSAIRY